MSGTSLYLNPNLSLFSLICFAQQLSCSIKIELFYAPENCLRPAYAVIIPQI